MVLLQLNPGFKYQLHFHLSVEFVLPRYSYFGRLVFFAFFHLSCLKYMCASFSCAAVFLGSSHVSCFLNGLFTCNLQLVVCPLIQRWCWGGARTSGDGENWSKKAEEIRRETSQKSSERGKHSCHVQSSEQNLNSDTQQKLVVTETQENFEVPEVCMQFLLYHHRGGLSYRKDGWLATNLISVVYIYHPFLTRSLWSVLSLLSTVILFN